MSAVFFNELSIPEPQHHLGIGGGLHGAMTGRQLEAIEQVLVSEAPDWLLVYGDTNSTLAGALAAAKLHIPVAHVGSEEHTSELQSLMRISYAVFCLKKQKHNKNDTQIEHHTT